MATQVVAGELYESITGQLFEIGRQLRQKSGYPFNPNQLKKVLQNAIEGRFPELGFYLYVAPAQQNGGAIKGFDLERHLQETKLIDHTLSLEDEIVKGWLANPSSYPEEFKGKVVFLWKSQRFSGVKRDVACLVWYDDRVFVLWYWLDIWWYGDDPVLLASF